MVPPALVLFASLHAFFHFGRRPRLAAFLPLLLNQKQSHHRLYHDHEKLVSEGRLKALCLRWTEAKTNIPECILYLEVSA